MIEAVAALVENWPGPFDAAFPFEPTDAWSLGIESIHDEISDLDHLVLDEVRLDPGASNKLQTPRRPSF